MQRWHVDNWDWTITVSSNLCMWGQQNKRIMNTVVVVFVIKSIVSGCVPDNSKSVKRVRLY